MQEREDAADPHQRLQCMNVQKNPPLCSPRQDTACDVWRHRCTSKQKMPVYRYPCGIFIQLLFSCVVSTVCHMLRKQGYIDICHRRLHPHLFKSLRHTMKRRMHNYTPLHFSEAYGQKESTKAENISNSLRIFSVRILRIQFYTLFESSSRILQLCSNKKISLYIKKEIPHINMWDYQIYFLIYKMHLSTSVNPSRPFRV